MQNLKKMLKSVFIIMIFAIFLQSCITADCPSCSENTRVSHPKLIEWKVALNSEYYDENTKTTIMSVSTDIEPTFIPTINPDSRECGNIPTWDGMPWESYFQKNHFKNLKGIIRIIGYPNESGVSPIYSIPASNIAEITSTSNPLLLPPHEYVIKEPCLCCDRIRNGWWIFDKFEMRLMAGYRNMNDSIIYPTANGTSTYYSDIFNTDRGGSNIVPGLEFAGLWSIKKIDPSEKFQIGVHTGLWVADESYFIPVGLHLRYTFNQKPNPFENNCNTPYVFGNIGLPLDFKTAAPIFGHRYYYSLGVGYDWAVSCGTDFSIDLGFRQMSLPLPAIDCCPEIPSADRYLYRLSYLGFLRIGLTF